MIAQDIFISLGCVHEAPQDRDELASEGDPAAEGAEGS